MRQVRRHNSGIRLYLTYEELKHGTWLDHDARAERLYLTYEELKQIKINLF
ncbi:hypothetical protein B4064_1983 [Caldibacillus thermoamylovorans]|nr:hypothetical protein B4065_3820 [Caldibacillus thermoamylovorans]KIO67178.1 hypothetical protein B4064_1983 [Caldibacillus thermoamylovorans]